MTVEALDRYKQRIKNSPATWAVVGGAIAVALLVWFLVAVSGWRDARAQEGHWAAMERSRENPSAFIYENEDFKQFKNSQQPWIRRFLPRLLAGSAADYSERLAAIPEKKLAELEGLAKKNAKNSTGPWFYYHIANIQLARGNYAKSRKMFEKADELAGKYQGHILTGHFRFITKDLELVKSQQEWSEEFAKRDKNRPVGDNPRVELLLDQGTITIALYYKESPALVQRFCDLVASGYYDGLPLYDLSKPAKRTGGGRVQGGCPYGNGQGELAPEGLPNKVIDRAHKKGTVSLELLGETGERASSNRFFIVLADSIQGRSNFDGKNSVIGQVTKGLKLLDKLFKGQRILRARVVSEGDLQGKLKLVDWPGKSGKKE